MTWLHGILLIVFAVSTVAGYLLIRNVPSLLHTPLMSGMNALSGITLIGALVALAVTFRNQAILSALFAAVAVIVATVNVIGGFGVTHRMLMMFRKKEDRHE
ncbi:MAG TPA: proton-translocating transhydrogenase family protein [Candidatus Izemoplasmatales bacterium]|nr:proton-translocating transhydrogenase family protein [Candidatus Izemoplasmatales bacterium]